MSFAILAILVRVIISIVDIFHFKLSMDLAMYCIVHMYIHATHVRITMYLHIKKF